MESGGGIERKPRERERENSRGGGQVGENLAGESRPYVLGRFIDAENRPNLWGTCWCSSRKEADEGGWRRVGFFFAARKACKLEWRETAKGKFSAFLNSEARNIKLSRGQLSI